MSDDAIMNDLCLKVSQDVGAAINRVLAIAPNSYGIVIAAVVPPLAMLAAELDVRTGGKADPNEEQMRHLMLLAALVAARSADGRCSSGADALKIAHDDFQALHAAGRL